MSDLARTSQGYAPLANGPLPKPSGLRMPYLNHLKKFPVPFTVASFGVWAVTLVSMHFKLQLMFQVKYLSLVPMYFC